MAVNFDIISDKVFKVIKGSGHDVKMYDSTTGDETVDPAKSRYFYVKNPNYMINIDEESSEIKFHEGSNDNVPTNLKSIINNIKHLAKGYMLDFDHRQFGKELKPKNYAWKVGQNKDTQMADVTTEGYTPLQGSTKTSEQKLEGVKVIVRHNKAVDETSRGARSRNIQGIFIETAEGERFKYPHIHLNGARAMARHVHAGGKPHDEVGEAIVELSDQLAKLKEVTKYARRFSQVQEQAADILPLVDNKIANVKSQIHKLTTANGYTSFVESYKKSEAKDYSIESLEELKNKFTVTKFDEKIGEVLPLLQSIMDEAKQEQDNSSKAIADRIMSKIKAGDPVEVHSPNATQQEYDPEKVGAFTNRDAKIAYKLADLAAKIKDDEMSVFLARLSDKYEMYAADPNIQMKINKEPETYKIQDWEKATAAAIARGIQMKKVEPEMDKLPKAESVVPDAVAEIEEAVKDFGTDESFLEGTEADEIKMIMAKHPQDVADMKKSSDLDSGSELYQDLFAYYLNNGEMPYGTAKARDGDPVEWIMNRLDDMNMLEGDIKDKEDYMAKKKALQDIQMDPNTHKDEKLKKELMRRKAELDAEAKEKGMKEDPMTQADMDRIAKQEFDSMAMDGQQEFEDYRDAVQDDIKDPTSVYAGKSTEEIIAMLRKEADGIGYADVSDGDRHPSEPEWLRAIADEMEKSKTEASGYEGQSEPHMHTITVDGDYDMDRGITEKDCEEMEYDLAKGGIKAQCQPNEMVQGGVHIHTMSPRSAVLDALGNAGYEVNEEAQKDQNIERIKDLAGL